MPYIITNGKKYVYHDPASGRYSLSPNKAHAAVFERQEKALNVLKNCVPKKDRQGLRVVNTAPPTAENTTKALVSIVKKPEKTLDEYMSFVDDLFNLAMNFDQIKQEINSNLSQTDQKITDIQHFIEFKGQTVNCYQGWLVFVALRELLKERRKYKDILFMLQYLGDTSFDENSLKKLKTNVESMNNREYTPRQFEELFTKAS